MLRAFFQRLNTWIGHIANWTGLAGALGGGAVLTAFFSWAASGWEAIAAQGWGAVAFAGAFMAAFLLLAVTGSLALYRYFRPLPVIVPPPAATLAAPVVEVVSPSPPEPTVAGWMSPLWALEAFGNAPAWKQQQELESKISEKQKRLGASSPEEYSVLLDEISELQRDAQTAKWRVIWSVIHKLRDNEILAEGFADPGDKEPIRIRAVEWRKYAPDNDDLFTKRSVALGSIEYTGVMIGKPVDEDDIPF
jgi:hypothetical protein